MTSRISCSLNDAQQRAAADCSSVRPVCSNTVLAAVANQLGSYEFWFLVKQIPFH